MSAACQAHGSGCEPGHDCGGEAVQAVDRDTGIRLCAYHAEEWRSLGSVVVALSGGRQARRRARLRAGLRDRGVSRGWRRRYSTIVCGWHNAPLYPGDPRRPGVHYIYAPRMPA